MQVTNLRRWAPLLGAVAIILLILGLYGNGGAPARGGVNPLLGLTTLGAILGSTANVLIAVLPLVLAAASGYFLVHWWMAPDDDTNGLHSMPSFSELWSGATHRKDVTCPACATPVEDGWQACPSCGYRMHVIQEPPQCSACHHAVAREWRVCPHCAAELPIAPEERRVPARAMVEAARLHSETTALVKSESIASPIDA
ncbi:MAG: zinc ribbon domain-containing protein [Chloroflexi bacterium]|nr:zinc ribbon domain-containing protein [Chloroflexota bacterium]